LYSYIPINPACGFEIQIFGLYVLPFNGGMLIVALAVKVMANVVILGAKK
jgi:hypothetical protein